MTLPNQFGEEPQTPEPEPDGEPLDAGDEEGVPADLVELYEIIEWQRACDEGGS